MDELEATMEVDNSTQTCLHNEWEWRPRGFRLPVQPAYAVYCSGCNTLLFTIVYDAEKKEHRVGVPNFHTIKWQEYILDMFRKRFPNDKVILWKESNPNDSVNH